MEGVSWWFFLHYHCNTLEVFLRNAEHSLHVLQVKVNYGILYKILSFLQDFYNYVSKLLRASGS